MRYFTLGIILLCLGLGGAVKGADAAQKREKPRAWKDYEEQAAKVTAATKRLREYLTGPVSRAVVHDKSTMELLLDESSIPREIRTQLASELGVWLKGSRKLAQEALSYSYASDRHDAECQAWIAVFQEIYGESDLIARKLMASRMKDIDFVKMVGKITVLGIWDGAQLAGAMRPCYMHKRMGVFVDAAMKERRNNLESEANSKNKNVP